jgi:gliding motility-associated-like protein
MQNLEAGSYHIVVRDSNGCEIDTTVSLTMPAPLQITESHLSPPCPEVCAGSITLTPTGGTVPYSYFWSNNQTTAHIESLCAGNYSVTVSDAHNCIATFSIMLEDSSHFPVNIEAWGEPDTLYEGYQTTLHVTECGNDFTYQWRPAATLESPTAPNTVATPTQTTNYIITATDLYGCVVTDTVLIYVRKLICDEPYVFVPNAFTPNGDGKNDVLFVRGEIVTAIKFEIFDRWGEKVFSTTQQSEGWDGTFRGKMCEVGVYDYYLEVICIGENHFFKKGNVTLIR